MRDKHDQPAKSHHLGAVVTVQGRIIQALLVGALIGYVVGWLVGAS